MILDGVLFLASHTARSKCYAQALRQAGLFPGRVIIFGDDGAKRPGQGSGSGKTLPIEGIFLPDLNESLSRTVESFGCVPKRIAATSVNDPAVYEAVAAVYPRLIIYSGYGGEIVGKKILDMGIPFLHMHSGWLPDYRGSTTLYFNILKEKRCGVSAILLKPEIDMGSIVMRAHYDPPRAGSDIDYLYDGAIRADLLVRTLSLWQQQGGFSEAVIQNASEGAIYYVIHPVLKHLAILSLASAPAPL